jgi:hypothetical protein
MKVLLHRRRCFTQACAYFRKYIATWQHYQVFLNKSGPILLSNN